VDIKDVLLLCDVGRTTQGRMDTAFELATVYGAVVTAIFISPTPKFMQMEVLVGKFYQYLLKNNLSILMK